MTLLDATPYDPAPARRRKIKILVAVIVILVLATVVWTNRYWSEERVVDKFFAALENMQQMINIKRLIEMAQAIEAAEKQSIAIIEKLQHQEEIRVLDPDKKPKPEK